MDESFDSLLRLKALWCWLALFSIRTEHKPCNIPQSVVARRCCRARRDKEEEAGLESKDGLLEKQRRKEGKNCLERKRREAKQLVME